MKKHLSILIFIIFYLFYIFFSYKSFGITWDEQAVYERGKMLYKHLVDPNNSSNNDLVNRKSTDDVWTTYNNSYATVLYFFNQNQSYERYHLLNLLFSTSIFFSAYFFLYLKYKKPWLAILGPLFIVFNPRFFGDIAANPKDMPFAVFYFLSIFAIYFISSVKNILVRILVLGFLFAFTQSSRTLGFTIYFILFIYDFIKSKDNFIAFLRQEVLYIIMIFICSNFFMIITWPYIGSNYFKNFIDVLGTTKQFPWMGTVFFMGKNYFSLDLPRYYIPVWLIISTPIFIIISSIGSLFFLKKLWKKNEILFLSTLSIGINLIIYLITKPVVYNGVRHFLFLLPFFSLLTAVFVIEILQTKHKKIKNFFMLFIIINCLWVVFSQIRLFPYQYLYFNELIGGLKGGSRYFVTDYWNASFKEGILWLNKNKIKENKKYSIYLCGSSLSMFYYLSDNMEWVASHEKADFAVCSEHTKEYKKIPGKIIYTVERNSVPLNYVIEVLH